MRASAVIVSSLSLLLLVSACKDFDPTYDHPTIRGGHYIPMGYGHTHPYPDEEVVVTKTETTATQTQEVTQTEAPAPVAEVPAPSAAPYGDLVNETYFRHGSSYLNSNDKKAIKAVANDIKANPATPAVTVVGHASKRVDGHVKSEDRKEEINYNIAQKRATAVTKYLNKSGVDASKITSVSKGDQEPNAVPGDRTQESADRRVEIFSKVNP